MFTFVTVAEASISTAQNKSLLYFYQENRIYRKYKMNDNIVLDDGFLKSDGTQHTKEKLLTIFHSANVLMM